MGRLSAAVARVARPLSLALALSAWGVGCERLDLAALEDGEWLPGGETTNTRLLGGNAFITPAANLESDTRDQFFLGDSFFDQAWVEAPGGTAARDGLGPLFNARACSGCHARDGRAPGPDGDDVLGALVRLSIGPDGLPEPTYGGQLQDLAVADVPSEGRVVVTWEEAPGTYGDGMSYSLRRPTISIDELPHGPFADDVRMSLRVAPQMVGLGLLEAILEADLDARVDPDDADGDGISGVRAVVVDSETGQLATGRFGWKAEQPRVITQSAGAFAGDLGVTSRLVPADDCTPVQADCLDAPNGGDPELEEHLLQAVAIYAATLAVPVRRDWDEDEVLRGKLLFGQSGCDACHTPSYVTGESAVDELEGQLIWPYTDLLLHDMGEELSDDRPLPHADGSEWKTPPLWSLGLIPGVNLHDHLLHDGRARGVAEAILWHGGEGQEARDAFVELAAEDRDALVRFVESL